MTIGMWVLVGLAVGLCYVFVFSLLKVSSDADRRARRAEKRADPFSDVDITITGSHQ
jgi:hypothetical protein